MNKSNAKNLLYRVLDLMVHRISDIDRRELQRVGESLLGERKDLKVRDVLKRLDAIENDTDPGINERKVGRALLEQRERARNWTIACEEWKQQAGITEASKAAAEPATDTVTSKVKSKAKKQDKERPR